MNRFNGFVCAAETVERVITYLTDHAVSVEGFMIRVKFWVSSFVLLILVSGCARLNLQNKQPSPPLENSNQVRIMKHDFKTIRYRGGIVTFRIPSNWREEHEAEGGGTFYNDTPDSGTLRLNIITAKAPHPITFQSGPDILAGIPPTTTTVERLPNNCALVRYARSEEEEGHQLNITYWLVAQPLPPNHSRIATFSYTILAHQRSDPQFQAELDMLDREIRAAAFAPMVADNAQ
jgi:hypothetical protein